MSLCDIIVSFFGLIEQGVHHTRKSLFFSMGKMFLEHAIDAVVELVYKFDEKSTVSV